MHFIAYFRVNIISNLTNEGTFPGIPSDFNGFWPIDTILGPSRNQGETADFVLLGFSGFSLDFWDFEDFWDFIVLPRFS